MEYNKVSDKLFPTHHIKVLDITDQSLHPCVGHHTLPHYFLHVQCTYNTTFFTAFHLWKAHALILDLYTVFLGNAALKNIATAQTSNYPGYKYKNKQDRLRASYQQQLFQKPIKLQGMNHNGKSINCCNLLIFVVPVTVVMKCCNHAFFHCLINVKRETLAIAVRILLPSALVSCNVTAHSIGFWECVKNVQGWVVSLVVLSGDFSVRCPSRPVQHQASTSQNYVKNFKWTLDCPLYSLWFQSEQHFH